MIYEGTVTGIQDNMSADFAHWVTVSTAENKKPLSLREFKGVLPQVGQYISVEANEGTYWFFGEHRSLVIRDKPLPKFVVTEHYPNLKLKGKPGRAAEIILAKFYLENMGQVSGDDIVEEIREAFPENNPRIAGIGFQLLSRQKIIHIVGWARTKHGHHRQNPVWELTRK